MSHVGMKHSLMALISLLVGAPGGTVHVAGCTRSQQPKLTANCEAPGIVSFINRSLCFQTFIYFSFVSFSSICNLVFSDSQFSSIYHVLGAMLAQQQNHLCAITPFLLSSFHPFELPAQNLHPGPGHYAAPCISPSLLGT